MLRNCSYDKGLGSRFEGCGFEASIFWAEFCKMRMRPYRVDVLLKAVRLGGIRAFVALGTAFHKL